MLRKIEWKGSENLFRGLHKDDDAVVAKMPDGRLLASTVDVFTPVVDDPYEYGRIAAANSLSDVYAMGGEPHLALAILGYPPQHFGPDTPARIIQGAIDKCWEAGVVLGGGHTVKTAEVLFGLSVVGDFPSGRVLEKGGARPGDHLVLTKPLGIGILTTAIKRGVLSGQRTTEVVELMSTLNRTAAGIAVEVEVECCTDVTGFGFLGHLLEVCEASGVDALVKAQDVPILEGARELAMQGVVPGGSKDNLAFAGKRTTFCDSVDQATRILLADAQTSGGLIVAVPEDALLRFGELCQEAGQFFCTVGRFKQGKGNVEVA